MSLVDALADLGKPQAVTRLGRVVSTTPLMVTLHGNADAVPLPRLASYTPTAGDYVLIVGESRVVLGKVIPADASAGQNVTTRSY